jgi:hypothetical protein
MLLVPTRLGTSAIHGLGVFAATPIAAGTAVWRFDPRFDRVIDCASLGACDEQVRRMLAHYAYRIDEGDGRLVYYLCADDARFMNHDEAPNCIERPEAPGINLAARDIAPGEELTCDYRGFDLDHALKLRPH